AIQRSFLPMKCHRNLVCLSGGECQELDEAGDFRCKCPLGTTGTSCEQVSSIKYPKFQGIGHIAFPALKKAELSFNVKMEFKPESETGLLLFTADQPDAKFDFFSISLVSSKIEFRYDCGSGMAIIKSSNVVKLNMWNMLVINKNEQFGMIQLNNETIARGKSKGNFSRINFQNNLYLGGYLNLSEVSDRIGIGKGFDGCIRLLQINKKLYDMRKGEFVGDALGGVDVENCITGICNKLTCFNGGQCVAENAEFPRCDCPLGTSGDQCQTSEFIGSSFLQFTGLRRNVLSFTEIEVHLKPKKNYGLILYNGYAKDKTGDFISLSIVDGFVEYRFDLGTGPAILRSKYRIELDVWHIVIASRTGRKGYLKVDDQQLVEGMASGAFTQLTLTLDLFVGGHRNFDEVVPAANINEAFYGCIQKVLINEKPMKLLLEAITGMNLINCNHACSDIPCGEYGKCTPQLSDFTCSCDLGYAGNVCETKLDASSISAASFSGNSYLLYVHPTIVQRASGREFMLQFKMKASEESGLIFWVSEEESGPNGDYLAVGLHAGFLEMRFDLGTGDAHIVHNFTRLDDNKWHFISIHRFERTGFLQVDGQNITKGFSPGEMKQLTSPGSIFLGGMEDIVQRTLKRYKSGLVGCLQNVTLGGDLGIHLVEDALEGSNINSCGVYS
ncbi:hypothetical protein HELRODRAFT_63300, partial [Helobdella robusta]|uniref:Agrin n=1 Tax=Helobdella robusta TaxID=6412 RepID=T1FXD7_HELRO